MKHILKFFREAFQEIIFQIGLKFHRIRLHIRILRSAREKIREDQRILDQCPDEESRRRKAQEIKIESRAEVERLSRIIPLHLNMITAGIDMWRAIYAYYKYSIDTAVTEEEHDMAPQNFKKAKEQVIMNAGWLVVAGEEYLRSFICKLETVEFGTCTSYDEWYIFYDKLFELARDPEKRHT